MGKILFSIHPLKSHVLGKFPVSRNTDYAATAAAAAAFAYLPRVASLQYKLNME